MCLFQLKLIRTLRFWVLVATCSIAIYIFKMNRSLLSRTKRTSSSLFDHVIFDDEQQRTLYKYWMLQRQRRFNYTAIMLPCRHSMQWKSYYPERNASVMTSAKTSRVELDIEPAGQYSKLVIHSYNLLGRPKHVGGDTWRIFVRGEVSVPVTLIDHMDGTYEAFFLITTAGSYHVELFLEYTMCDGFKDPPPDWFIRGAFLCFDPNSSASI